MLLNTTLNNKEKTILKQWELFTSSPLPLHSAGWIHFRSLFSLRSLRENDWCAPTSLNAYGFYVRYFGKMAELGVEDAEQLHQEDANIKGKIIRTNNDTIITKCFVDSLNNTPNLGILYFYAIYS